LQEARLDGGSADFFAVLSVVFDYAFEKNPTEGSDCNTDLSYLVEGGLVDALTHMYKTLSRQMIVNGQRVDRSLAALCKTCLSVFEEIPSGQFHLKDISFIEMLGNLLFETVCCAARKQFSVDCLSSIYCEWFISGLKQPHPTTIYNILEVSVVTLS
jgi:hypothetical protein